MRRASLAALFLACAFPPARADSFPAMRIGVLGFATTEASVSGAAAGDLFGAALYRSFPGLSVIERARIEAAIPAGKLDRGSGGVDQETAALLQDLMGVDSLLTGSVMALERNADGDGGTLMLSARLVRLSSGEILWADTRTVRVGTPALKRLFGAGRTFGQALAGNLLELGVFELVQDLGKRLPKTALAPPRRPAAAEPARDGAACAPPVFYEALPRDEDWYYGAGKDSDAVKARAAALASLAEQATGRPAEAAGNFPAVAGLLAGWEQDDSRRCGDVSYVLVRIRKELVRESLAENSGAKPAAMSLDQRLDRIEESNARLLEGSATTPGRTLAPLLVKDTVASVKALIGSGSALDRVARANVASAEMIFSDLSSPQARCGARKCPAGPTLEQAGLIAAARRKLAAGTVTMDDVVGVHAIYFHYAKDDADRNFLDAVISRERPAAPGAEDYEHTRELAFPLAWSAALGRDDWVGFFKYCTEYLRLYPKGVYAATAERNRENAANILMMRNIELAAAPGSARAD